MDGGATNATARTANVKTNEVSGEPSPVGPLLVVVVTSLIVIIIIRDVIRACDIALSSHHVIF